jgi:hypothetical protein
MNEIVTVHVGLHGLLPKLAVIPVGRAEVLNVTGVVDPPVRVAVIDDEPLVPPWFTLSTFGEGAERLKLNGAGGATVSDRVVVRVSPPPTAVIVTVVVPSAAVAVAANETVAVQVGVHGLLVKVAVTPAGNADVEKVKEG